MCYLFLFFRYAPFIPWVQLKVNIRQRPTSSGKEILSTHILSFLSKVTALFGTCLSSSSPEDGLQWADQLKDKQNPTLYAEMDAQPSLSYPHSLSNRFCTPRSVHIQCVSR